MLAIVRIILKNSMGGVGAEHRSLSCCRDLSGDQATAHVGVVVVALVGLDPAHGRGELVSQQLDDQRAPRCCALNKVGTYCWGGYVIYVDSDVCAEIISQVTVRDARFGVM